MLNKYLSAINNFIYQIFIEVERKTVPPDPLYYT